MAIRGDHPRLSRLGREDLGRTAVSLGDAAHQFLERYARVFNTVDGTCRNLDVVLSGGLP